MANSKSNNFNVEITDIDKKILNDDLLDINEWIQNAVKGKINSCWKRMQTKWTLKLINDENFTDAIPSSKNEFVDFITTHEDYQTRIERESEKI
jgi:hypothetical protein